MKVPFNLRTPLSLKQLNIQAFTRLLDLSSEKNYRGARLDDRTETGLTYCVFTWLKLSGFTCEIRGHQVVIEFEEGPFIIQVAGTHISDPHYPESVYSDEHELQIYNLLGFVKWYDENF